MKTALFCQNSEVARITQTIPRTSNMERWKIESNKIAYMRYTCWNAKLLSSPSHSIYDWSTQKKRQKCQNG